MSAIKHVKSLRENIDDKATLNVAFQIYFNEEYTQCLDDYNHIISTHSNHLEQINKQLDKCELSKCKMAKRCKHNDRRRNGFNDKNNEEEYFKIQLYTGLIDRIHFWLHHQFDVGMRMESEFVNERKDNEDLIEDDSNQNEYFDQEFAKLRKEITRRRDKWRINDSELNASNVSNKYTMHVEDGQFEKDYGDNQTTYTDSLLHTLKEEGISKEVMTKISKFLSDEHYDTDAIIADIIDYKHGSNVISNISQRELTEVIEEISEGLNGMLFFSDL